MNVAVKTVRQVVLTLSLEEAERLRLTLEGKDSGHFEGHVLSMLGSAQAMLDNLPQTKEEGD